MGGDGLMLILKMACWCCGGLLLLVVVMAVGVVCVVSWGDGDVVVSAVRMRQGGKRESFGKAKGTPVFVEAGSGCGENGRVGVATEMSITC